MSSIEKSLNTQGFALTTLNAVTNWARSNAAWPMPMGLACCAIEMMAFAGPKYDVSRFGSEVFRFSPRQADVMRLGYVQNVSCYQTCLGPNA